MRMVLSIACLLLAACSPPDAPEEERRPEPQATAAVVQAADAYKDSARRGGEDRGSRGERKSGAGCGDAVKLSSLRRQG